MLPMESATCLTSAIVIDAGTRLGSPYYKGRLRWEGRHCDNFLTEQGCLHSCQFSPFLSQQGLFVQAGVSALGLAFLPTSHKLAQASPQPGV